MNLEEISPTWFALKAECGGAELAWFGSDPLELLVRCRDYMQLEVRNEKAKQYLLTKELERLRA